MPFSRPTLTQLTRQAAADIAAAQRGADPLLRFSNLGVLGKILAAAVNGLYGYQDWIARMAVPWTAKGEFLAGWGALKGLTYKPAVQAAFYCSFATTGANIGSGVTISRLDGAQFLTTASGTIGGGNVVVAAQAVVAGSAGNTTPGAVMTLAAPIAGVTSSGVAATAITAGADVETEDDFLTRVLEAFAQPPQGGAAADYVSWALAVPGVTRAWCAPLAGGDGTVTVYFMMDVVESGTAGFPVGTNGVATLETRASAATGDQLTVANAIYPLRPVTALVTAAAPGNNAIAMTIKGAAGWAAGVMTSVQAAIDLALLSLATPGGVYIPGDLTPGVINLSAIEAAILTVAGTAGFVITAVSCSHGTVSPSGDGNITSNSGYLPTRGVIAAT